MSKVLLSLLFLALTAAAPAQTTASVLTEMASRAGVIFAGNVLAVTHHNAQGYVEIQFHVDSAVLHCAAGSTYTVREWAGRWAGQPERYRPGQQLLMLLTAPGPAGLSAPVNGSDGAIPIVPGAVGTLGDVGAAAEPVVDLRLLATRVTPVDPSAIHTGLLVVDPVTPYGFAQVWPALGNVLALLRGGAGA